MGSQASTDRAHMNDTFFQNKEKMEINQEIVRLQERRQSLDQSGYCNTPESRSRTSSDASNISGCSNQSYGPREDDWHLRRESIQVDEDLANLRKRQRELKL